MSIIYVGHTDFIDQYTPAPNKNEFGVDTLSRRMRGAAPKLAAFVGALSQGQTYSFAGSNFYLQSWSVDDHHVYPTVTMNYKGLIGGVLPAQTAEDQWAMKTISVSTDDPEKASRDIQYYGFQTTYRYIASSRPIGQSNAAPSVAHNPRIIISIITDEEGKRWPGNAPIGLVIALTPPIANILVGMRASPIAGSPYFEVEETIERGYLA